MQLHDDERRTRSGRRAHNCEWSTMSAPYVLTIEDHRFFSETLRLMLGRCLSEEHGESAGFRLTPSSVVIVGTAAYPGVLVGVRGALLNHQGAAEPQRRTACSTSGRSGGRPPVRGL